MHDKQIDIYARRMRVPRSQKKHTKWCKIHNNPQQSDTGKTHVWLGKLHPEAEKLGRPSTALELCLYFHTKDHEDVTFLDSRVEKIVTAIQPRRIELTQSQPDTPIDETELYLSVVERDDKGRTYGLGSRRRHATFGGARGGVGSFDLFLLLISRRALRKDF
ncbi:hypothetical protein Scep_006406 [Stephania cephalantha]|uniref:Uncharacterized protein n=1 Tax=Stephania cephalantha TaxID=152367 RepID=A0AAP0K9U7_9MAGN